MAVAGAGEMGDAIERLAKTAAQGDKVALDQLLVLIQPVAAARCAKLLPNRLDAEEACQDALIAVSRRITTFEGRSKFSTWLYQVATNASVDTYRRIKRRQSVADVEVEEREAPGRTSQIAGNRVDLLDALDHIDPRFGEPVVLRDVFDLDYAEIAAELGIPEGTVKSRIHEGRRTLKYLMSR